MRVSVLIENECCEDKTNLEAEHGLSLHIHFGGKNILFDTGATDKFIENAKKMAINIEDIDIVILSHAHKDHAGGLMKFLKQNKKAKVYMSKQATHQYYIKMLMLPMNIGIEKEVFQQFAERIVFIDQFIEIVDHVYLLPNISLKSFPLGKSSKKLLVQKEGKFLRDSFDHELSLIINNYNKIEVFTGCSHNGISNMVENAISYFETLPIHSVIGGFHLMGIPFKSKLGESQKYVKELGHQMNKYSIDKIYTAHCTGKKAYKILKSIMQDKMTYIHTGMQFEL